MAGEFQPGYSTQRSCYKNVYREEYVPGVKSSPGYIKSFTETIEVPCRQNGWASTNRHQRRYRSNESWNATIYQTDKRNCRSGQLVTGGLIGGGVSAALSKKDAYGWSVPLGTVLGMGILSPHC